LEKERKDLQVSKAKSEAILASIGEGLIVVNMDMRIVLINKTAEVATGWSGPEVLNKAWSKVIILETEDGKKVSPDESPLFLAIRNESTTTTTTTYYCIRKDKTKLPVAITVSPVKIGNELIGAIFVFRDVSHEWEIDEAKKEFVSLASHQLRTPLVGVQWVIERFLKKEKHLSDKGKEYLKDIRVSCQRLSNLVDLLLNVSRIESGNISISPKQLELVGFIEEFLKEYSSLYAKKKITLIFKEHPKTLKAVTDSNALRNIMQTIISNTIEYTKEGGRVEVSLRKKDHVFLFAVSDTGIGIPEKNQATIFNKFARGSNAKLMKPEGAGFGLYFAKRATDLLGGKIWFKSKENKGTTFYVELPLKIKVEKGSKDLVK